MACCKGCTERVLGCHDTCEKYIDEKNQKWQREQQINQARFKTCVFDRYAKERNVKYLTERDRRKRGF